MRHFLYVLEYWIWIQAFHINAQVFTYKCLISFAWSCYWYDSPKKASKNYASIPRPGTNLHSKVPYIVRACRDQSIIVSLGESRAESTLIVSCLSLFLFPCLFSSSCFSLPYLPWKQHFIKASFAGWLHVVFSMEIKGLAERLIARSEISEGHNLAAATCSALLPGAALVKLGDNYGRDDDANGKVQCKQCARQGFLHSLLAKRRKINNAN